MNFEDYYIDELIDIRLQSRLDKDYKLSDEIRNYLDTKLVFIFDLPGNFQEVYYLPKIYFKGWHRYLFKTQRLYLEWRIKEDIRLEKVVDAWIYSNKF